MARDHETYARVLALASRQHGVVGRSQLLEIGISEGVIRHWWESGRLLKVFRGTFALGRLADQNSAFWMAGTLRAGSASVLSGVSAAAAWKIMEPSSRIHVVRPRGRVFSERGHGRHDKTGLSVSCSSLFVNDVTHIGPVPVMTPARLLIDIARSIQGWELRRAFLNAGRSGLLNHECLEQCRLRGASFKGHARLMELVDQWRPDTGRLRSSLESGFLLLCGKYGIPAPKTNVRNTCRSYPELGRGPVKGGLPPTRSSIRGSVPCRSSGRP